MPPVPPKYVPIIRDLVKSGCKAKTAPVVLLVSHLNSWTIHVNGTAIKIMACLPIYAARFNGRHRSWGNAGWAGTTRVYAFSTSRLEVSLKTWDTTLGPRYM